MQPAGKFEGFKDKNGALLGVGDEVVFNQDADGYRHSAVSVPGKKAPFEGLIVGFAGDSDVVIELDGSRYSNPCGAVEKLAKAQG